MKRDLNLIRTILLDIEGCGYTPSKEKCIKMIQQWTSVVQDTVVDKDKKIEYVLHQIDLIQNAKYLLGKPFTRVNSTVIPGTLEGLSNEGHDFLDSIRHKRVFKKILSKLKKYGDEWTFDLIMKFSKEINSSIVHKIFVFLKDLLKYSS